MWETLHRRKEVREKAGRKEGKQEGMKEGRKDRQPPKLTTTKPTKK